jgi:dipeptidyl aminopeptidase/acylaminoacyl peptidase
MANVEQVFLRSQGDEAQSIELFLAKPKAAERRGAVLFVHGHQGTQRIGAREMVDNGALSRFASSLKITAASISQPGYGESDGPPDFCGPATQDAIRVGLKFLRSQPNVDPTRVLLYGVSRGAIASAVVATQDADLRAVILVAGIYDLAAAYEAAPLGIRYSIEQEAGTTKEAFDARSAIRYAANIRAETLILHGRHDDRALPIQAEEFAEAIKAGDTTASLKLFDCGHNIPPALRRDAMRPLYERVFGQAG